MIRKSLILKELKNGKAVFASQNFKKFERILQFMGKILDYDEIEDNSYEDEHCIQISKRTYLGHSGMLDDFINHSCNPNSGIKEINGKFFLIAIKRIKRGQEITWDYSTSMAENHWEMKCNCRSRNCRKVIRDFKYLPEKLQKRYINFMIVPKFVLKSL